MKIFGYKIIKQKVIEEREREMTSMHSKEVEKSHRLEKEIEKLENELEEVRNQFHGTTDDGTSKVLLEISEDLTVNTKTIINPELTNVLLNNDYILPSQLDDNFAKHLALLLAAYEALDYYIRSFER